MLVGAPSRDLLLGRLGVPASRRAGLGSCGWTTAVADADAHAIWLTCRAHVMSGGTTYIEPLNVDFTSTSKEAICLRHVS